MNSFENTASTSSPMSVSGGRYGSNSKPGLMQSTTPCSKPKLAQVFNRVAAKVKRSKNKNRNKNKIKNKNKNKNKNKSKAKIKNNRCSVNCFTNSNITPIKQHQYHSKSHDKVETKETDENIENIKNIENIENIDDNNNKSTEEEERRFTFNLKNNNDDLNTLIESKGYKIEKKLADTLQGQIYRCRIIKYMTNINYFDNQTVVIKVTRKDLHNEGMTILENGHKKKIQENIIKERDLLKELTFNHGNNENSPYMTRYIDFFENSNSYFLVLEDGGDDLFEYVVKCHNLLRKGRLDRKEWRLICKKIFKQIVELLDYLHNKHQICHLDISLENMLIKNGTILQNIHSKKITLNRNFCIKFCDFGLSEKFISNDFQCDKYVGKTRYKSPELWTKKLIFDARLNDIWSLGIALFMMIMGAPPLKYPDFNDDNFKLIINGQILQLIQSWNRAKYMTPQILDLLTKMLTKENKRINLDEIKRHSWVKLA